MSAARDMPGLAPPCPIPMKERFSRLHGARSSNTLANGRRFNHFALLLFPPRVSRTSCVMATPFHCNTQTGCSHFTYPN